MRRSEIRPMMIAGMERIPGQTNTPAIPKTKAQTAPASV
jgi:hypothetical protein